MKIAYIQKKFTPAHLAVIAKANEIIKAYQKQGFDLTLRQLYYQFVARDLIPNRIQEYKRLGEIINDARLGGLVSWAAIVDRTRNLKKNSHWESPGQIVKACAKQFQIDKWKNQDTRPEVWIEKDALAGVIEGVCERNDVSYFSCRGYTSQSELWAAGQRVRGYIDAGQDVKIIHLGDHDPSGIDMTRDITDRLRMFVGRPVEVIRIALNQDQIDQYSCPPNPAKLTDSRANKYVEEHGYESWELDALEPSVIDSLIQTEIDLWKDESAWAEAVEEEEGMKEQLETVAEEM